MSTLGIVIVVAGVGGLLCGVYLLGSHDGHTRGLEEVRLKEWEWLQRAAQGVDEERQKIWRETWPQKSKKSR